eukprot:Colp12_sorted_trinity150504_noHs@28217
MFSRTRLITKPSFQVLNRSIWRDSLRNGFVETVGKTPLIRLKTLSEQTGREILAKAEFMNAGGSVKDRAALFLIKDAEERGIIKPNGTIVEGTAGNTGIGLAHICNAKGYKCVIYMPNTQSKEKIDLLRLLGADVRPVPAVAFTDPNNYNHQAKRFAESIPNAVWTNQFDNRANRRAHIETTGPEIWEQTGGKIDAFTCATGTGGTLSGVSEYLKSKRSDIKIVLADPPGSVLFNYFANGKLERKGDGSITEGIGQGRVTDNLKGSLIDTAVYVPDEDSVDMVYHLLHKEGLCVGASSALNAAAAVQVAKTLPPGSTVVTVLCDSGLRYQARLFNRKWLEMKGFYNRIPEEYRKSIIDA